MINVLLLIALMKSLSIVFIEDLIIAKKTYGTLHSYKLLELLITAD